MSTPTSDTPARRTFFSAAPGYGLAVLSVAVALVVTYLLGPDALVTPVFLLAIILSAWFGGIGPGLIAAMLAMLAIVYFFLPPIYSLKFDLVHLPQLLAFFVSAVLVSSWSVARKRAEALLRQARDEQEAKVRERTADLSQSNEQLRTEIAERKRAEETLRRQANLLEQTHDAILVWELPGKIIYWNHGAEQLYGFPAQEAIGRQSHDLLRTEHPMPAEQFETMIERHGTWTGELTHQTRDGHKIVVESRHVLMREADGHRLVLETNRDITERKRAEETLREQAGLLDLTHDTIFVRSMDDVITYWNRGAEELYGWTSEEAVGRTSHEVLLTIFPAPLEEINEELIRTGRWEGELVHTRRDGTQVVVASRWALQRDESGRPVAVLETNNDITERRRAEESLRESESRYRYIFQAAGVSIWEEDFSEVKAAVDELKDRGVSDFRRYFAEHPEFVRRALTMVKVIDVNDATVKLFGGRSKDELLVSLDKIFVPETEEVFAGELTAIAEGRTSFASETVVQTLKGDRLTVLFTITFPPQPADLDSVLVSITDITERKRAEEALQKAQAELAHVTRVTAMGELTSSIAHEVNQPLAAIVTNANAALRWLATEPPNLDEARETVGRIARDGHRASEVVGRVRALFRKAAPDKARLDVNELIRDVVALVPSEVRRNRVVLRTELAADLPTVLGDRVQLQQVVLNLLINGIEAMSTVVGRPRDLLVMTQRDESGAVAVSVRDTGVGINPQNTDRLFDAFYTTKAEGMGMGLSVSRSIIEAHGGRLWAADNGGRGASFHFSLPAAGATVNAPEVH